MANNAFVTVPTHPIRFSNHRKEVREREARGNCVVPFLKTLILSSSFEIFLKMSPNSQAHPGGSRAPRLAEIRIWEIIGLLEDKMVLGEWMQRICHGADVSQMLSY